MQVNLNCNSPKPQFGMAIHSNEEVNKAIARRVKNMKAAERIENAFARAKKNDLVDITLGVLSDGESIGANIFTRDLGNETSYFSQHRENAFTKLTKGVVGFIEGLVVRAETVAQKVKKQMAIEDRLKNL